MADDQNPRPYRSSEPLARRAPAANPASGSDPLAELARLIGQTDPFAEFGRENARRPAAPPAAPPPPVRNFGADEYFGATTVPAAPPTAMEPPPLAPPSFAPPPGRPRQPYAGGNLYPAPAEPAGHPADETGGYQAAPYHPGNAHLGDEEEGYYDDALSNKRTAVMAVAVVVGLAVVGTAGAFGYRALFGPARNSSPPPVIKADTAPSKIVPATASKAPSKLITDRVTDRAQDERLVSREEKPVEIRSNPGTAAMPQAQASPPLTPAQAASGNGVITGEPKRVHTIAIRPDQVGMGDSQPATDAARPQPPARTEAQAPVNQQPVPAHAASSGPAVANVREPPPRPVDTRAVRPERHTTASASSNAPLSLNPNAPAPRAPVQTAAVAAPARIAPASTAHTGGYAVQVSSQRSEADAQASFRSLQAKYPAQLGNRQVSIRKVELGAKGTYYRAMVGPFANANEASTLCNGLKAAGAQCFIQRN